MTWFVQAVLVLVGAWLGWWLLWVPTLVWFTVAHRGWGLVVAIIIIDAYYGAFTAVPWQSLVALLVVGVMELVRPNLYTARTFE